MDPDSAVGALGDGYPALVHRIQPDHAVDIKQAHIRAVVSPHPRFVEGYEVTGRRMVEHSFRRGLFDVYQEIIPQRLKP